MAVVGLLLNQLVNQLSRWIDELAKRIDDLREDNNKQNDNLRSDMKDGFNKLEARQEAMRAEQQEENKALNEKLDRLIESRLSTPPRQ